MSNPLTHIDSEGRPAMVDVGHKEPTLRTATAGCTVVLPKEAMDTLQQTGMQTKKGSLIQTAILAGVMAAKKTSELIPLCHPLALEDCQVHIEPVEDTLEIQCAVRIHGKTGVEMEALTGASIAALTIYDMCKAMSHDIRISELQLIEKTGGKRDFKRETS